MLYCLPEIIILDKLIPCVSPKSLERLEQINLIESISFRLVYVIGHPLLIDVIE